MRSKQRTISEVTHNKVLAAKKKDIAQYGKFIDILVTDGQQNKIRK